MILVYFGEHPVSTQIEEGEGGGGVGVGESTHASDVVKHVTLTTCVKQTTQN